MMGWMLSYRKFRTRHNDIRMRWTARHLSWTTRIVPRNFRESAVSHPMPRVTPSLISANPSLLLQVLAVDLLHPSAEAEARKHKLKQLVQSPRSFFMDVKCPGCFQITTVFSHASTVVQCGSCNTVLCQPSGGKAKLTEGMS